VMVRRLKSELPKRWDGTSRFPKREITASSVEYTQPERDVYALLSEYSQQRLRQASDATEQYATEFVAMLLKKRLFSSPQAFYATHQQHMASLTSATRHVSVTRRPGIGILRSKIEQLDEENDNDTALEDSTGEARGNGPAFPRPGRPRAAPARADA